MKKILKPVIALLEIVSGWRIFEWIWDRKLFRSGATNLGSDAAAELIDSNPELQILDVRSNYEVAGGSLPGAIHISSGEKEFRERAAAELDSSKPVLVYCAGGFRSRKVVAALKEEGFREIFHLHRGFLAWKLGGGEIEKLP